MKTEPQYKLVYSTKANRKREERIIDELVAIVSTEGYNKLQLEHFYDMNLYGETRVENCAKKQ